MIAFEFASHAQVGETEEAYKLTDNASPSAVGKEAPPSLIAALGAQLGTRDYDIESIRNDGDIKRLKFVILGETDKYFILSLRDIDEDMWRVVGVDISIDSRLGGATVGNE